MNGRKPRGKGRRLTFEDNIPRLSHKAAELPADVGHALVGAAAEERHAVDGGLEAVQHQPLGQPWGQLPVDLLLVEKRLAGETVLVEHLRGILQLVGTLHVLEKLKHRPHL